MRRDGTELEIELTLAAPAPNVFVASMRDLRDRVELERRLTVTKYMRAATRAAAKLTARLDLAHVLDTAIETLAADFEAALARVWLHEPSSSTLRLQASAGLSLRVDGSSRATPLATHPDKVGVVGRTRAPFLRNGLVGDAEFERSG